VGGTIAAEAERAQPVSRTHEIEARRFRTRNNREKMRRTGGKLSKLWHTLPKQTGRVDESHLGTHVIRVCKTVRTLERGKSSAGRRIDSLFPEASGSPTSTCAGGHFEGKSLLGAAEYEERNLRGSSGRQKRRRTQMRLKMVRITLSGVARRH